MQLIDYADTIAGEAENLIANDQKEEAEDRFDSLAGVVGEKKARDLRDSAYYNVSNRKAADAKLVWGSGGSTKDYFQTLDDLRNSIEGEDFSGSKSLYNSITFQMANAAGQMQKEVVKYEADIYTAVRDGKYDAEESQARANRVFGDDLGEKRFEVLQNTLTKGAATDKKVDKLNSMVMELYTDPGRYEDVISYAASDGGNYGELAAEFAGIIMEDYTNQDAALTYSYTVPSSLPQNMRQGANERSVSTSYSGNVRAVHEELMAIGKVMPKDSESERKAYRKLIQSGQKQIIDFARKDANATKEDWEAFGSELLKDPAFKLAENIKAPQLPNANVIYKDGDTRTHPTTGKTYTMKDGQWQL
jgi:hypothetical protein